MERFHFCRSAQLCHERCSRRKIRQNQSWMNESETKVNIRFVLPAGFAIGGGGGVPVQGWSRVGMSNRENLNAFLVPIETQFKLVQLFHPRHSIKMRVYGLKRWVVKGAASKAKIERSRVWIPPIRILCNLNEWSVWMLIGFTHLEEDLTWKV